MSFNKTGVKREVFNDVAQILLDPALKYTMGIVVADEVGTNDPTTGRKVVKAGTPLTGNLDARTTPFTAANTDGSDAVGVLLHDVDVTVGDANGEIVIFGFINMNRIDTTTQAKINTAIQGKLSMIKFIKA